MTNKYHEFLANKAPPEINDGVDSGYRLNKNLFPFQCDIVKWALRRGRAAIFADCGMGKALMSLEWSRVVHKKTNGQVLMLTPLAVAGQVVREAAKFKIGASIEYDRTGESTADIVVTNYEMLNHFDTSKFSGVVIDESSILKNYTGKFRNQIIESFKNTPYRLACTATPAPNDHMELGNHSEFLGIMTRAEMLAMFFVHDGGETQKWRLKGHAEGKFWEWICTWAALIRKPSDLGYSDDAFILPELRMHGEIVDVDRSKSRGDMLFQMDAVTLKERLVARRESAQERAEAVADLANGNDDQWLIWCNLNNESAIAKKLISGAVEVKGSDSPAFKEKAILDFVDGKIRVLVSKASIFGLGVNLQNCNKIAFLGLSDSWEQYYQAIRRCWRFGQKQPVDCHIVTASTEGAVVRNIKRKEEDAKKMADEMTSIVRAAVRDNVQGQTRMGLDHIKAEDSGEKWRMMMGDCVELIKDIETGSVDYTIYSPPFASLFVYSDSDRDMGNCKNHSEFYEHFKFLASELLRVTRPGRLQSFHCMNLPTSKTKDGVIGLTDFRGLMIKLFQEAGWIYHSEVCIWKDPVTAMQRTKALGLLYKQLRKDSAMSRNGIADYLVTMRAPGENTKPITHTHEQFPVQFWQNYASPVWSDINQSRTLQHRSVREDKDERHLCPLQLDVIERGLDMWSAEGDLVLSPFGGIGSEGYCAVRKGRRFIGFELKQSYWKQACANLREASEETCTQLQMFGSK